MIRDHLSLRCKLVNHSTDLVYYTYHHIPHRPGIPTALALLEGIAEVLGPNIRDLNEVIK